MEHYDVYNPDHRKELRLLEKQRVEEIEALKRSFKVEQNSESKMGSDLQNIEKELRWAELQERELFDRLMRSSQSDKNSNASRESPFQTIGDFLYGIWGTSNSDADAEADQSPLDRLQRQQRVSTLLRYQLAEARVRNERKLLSHSMSSTADFIKQLRDINQKHDELRKDAIKRQVQDYAKHCFRHREQSKDSYWTKQQIPRFTASPPKGERPRVARAVPKESNPPRETSERCKPPVQKSPKRFDIRGARDKKCILAQIDRELSVVGDTAERKKILRQLQMQWHPDKNKSEYASEIFHRIQYHWTKCKISTN